MNHPCVCHGSFTCVGHDSGIVWLRMSRWCVCLCPFIRVTWLITWRYYVILSCLGVLCGGGGHDSFMLWLNCMSHWYVCHGSFICVIWMITWRCCLTQWLQRRVVWDMTRLCRGSFVWFLHVCTMAHSYVCGTWLMYAVTHSYDTSTCGQWLIHLCDMTDYSGMLFDPIFTRLVLCGTWLVYAVTLSCVGPESFMCVGPESFMCVPSLVPTAHSYVWLDSLPGDFVWSRACTGVLCGTWFIYMCDMTHVNMWHVSIVCATWHIYLCDMIQIYVSHNASTCVT